MEFEKQLIKDLTKDCVRCGNQYIDEMFFVFGLCEDCFNEFDRDPSNYDCADCARKCDYQFRTEKCYIGKSEDERNPFKKYFDEIIGG